MRILAIGNLYPPAATGGTERVFEAAMCAAVRAGHEVRVLTTAPVPGAHVPAEVLAAERAGRGPWPVHRELDWWWRDFDWPGRSALDQLRLVRRSAAVLRRHLAWEPDVVSWWGIGGLPLSLLEQVRRAGVPAVGLVGDDWMVYGFEVDPWLARPRLARLAEPLTGAPARVDPGRTARWLFVSEYVRDRARQEGWQLPDTAIVRPGVDPARFPFTEPGAWAWRLACIGRVDPRKGVATAVEALAHLPEEATLDVVGDTERDHRAELEELAARLGVGDRVRFDRVEPERASDAYAAADAILFPVTWQEPWGLVPLEAMSVGRPVVATGTGGSGEYLRDAENALLFRPGDAAALADRVARMAGDAELRARLIAEGRATAGRYTQEAFERAVVSALERAGAAP